ncbi:MAG: hypothetical protein P8100_11145 [bacterium]
MEAIIKNWQKLEHRGSAQLNRDTTMLHHAVQFLAYVANHYIPEKKDDSHTAMRWEPSLKAFVGQAVATEKGHFFVTLTMDPLSISLRDAGMEAHTSCHLTGKSKQEVMAWLKEQIRAIGLPAEKLDDRLHFSIPEHEVSKGAAFQFSKKEHALELIRYRENGHLMLNHFSADFSSAHPLYVWPHHFDEGCYVPLEKLNEEVIRSLSFGLAVPDHYYDGPYFYVNAWNHKGISYDRLPPVTSPGQWHLEEWEGQVLELSKIIELPGEEQARVTFRFMEEALKNARLLAGWSYKG